MKFTQIGDLKVTFKTCGPELESSLRLLWVLCDFAVDTGQQSLNRRVAEEAEEAQRTH
jgi:hypothetical protein